MLPVPFQERYYAPVLRNAFVEAIEALLESG